MRIMAWFLICGLLAVGSGLGKVVAQDQPVLNVGLENGTVLVPKNQVVLLISDDRQTVTGYAEGFQVPHPLKKMEGVEPVPIVGPGTVGAVRNGNYILAFSGLLGKWDELELAPSENGNITIGSESIVIQSETGLSYHFRANWGKWFTHEEIMRGDVKEHLAKNGLKNELEPIRQVHLKLTYLDAAKIRDFLQQKYEAEIGARRLPSLGAVTLGGQNLLLIGGDESLVNEIESWVTNLDKETVPFASGIRLDPQKSKQDDWRGMMMGRNPTGASGFPGARSNRQGDTTKDLEELKKQLANEEAKALELAESLRGIAASKNHPQMVAFREAVLRAFRLKQEVRQIEIGELKEKLDAMETELKQRSSNELEIVSRRLVQLLDPKFNWEEESAEKKQLQDAIVEKSTAEDRVQSRRGMLSDASRGPGMGFPRGGASGLSRSFRPGTLSPPSSNSAGTSADGTDPAPEEVLVVRIVMPNSFRVVDGSLLDRSTSHEQYVYARHKGMFTIRLDRMAGLHEWEIVIDVKLLPGKSFLQGRDLPLSLSPFVERLMSEEVSGIVVSGDFSGMSVHLGDKNFANDPLNPLNFSEGAIAVVNIRAQKKKGELVKSETELVGNWYRSASRVVGGSPVRIGNGAGDSNKADLLSLKVENGRWESTFRGNTTLFAAKYDFEARPQRVTLTKLNADRTESDTVYERLIEIRNGDLYTAVNPNDASGERLTSFDDKGGVIETYARELEANEEAPEKK
jgi:hypothetical protein